MLLISVMFNALTVYMGSLFSAANETKKSATTTIISAISNTLLNAVLIPLIGALGAAIATAAAYMIMWLIRYIMLKKIIALKIEVFRDGFVYALLCLQVVLEHLEGHFYWGQIAIFGIIARYLSRVFQKYSTRNTGKSFTEVICCEQNRRTEGTL